jgi:hypothetical protein
MLQRQRIAKPHRGPKRGTASKRAGNFVHEYSRKNVRERKTKGREDSGHLPYTLEEHLEL